MIKERQVLGIDFGTANSYFCKFLTHPHGQKIRVIDFGNRQLGGISTTILLRKNGTPVVGRAAEEEWGDATPGERKSYRLRTHFKPEITHSEDARADAVTFLKTIADHLLSKHISFHPAQHHVVLGVPAEADEQFREALRQIARDAGYGEVHLVYEPVGAMLYHLWNEDITPRETQAGVLVVDFGGGTCDFAFMQRLEIVAAWGDMMLGGRLFDDLFYQWLADQNPRLEKQLKKSGDTYYVHWLSCREAKEAFSDAMNRDRESRFRYKLGQMHSYGAFRDLTWREFERRARAYRPSAAFAAQLKEGNTPVHPLLSGKSLDLLDWFQRTFEEGLTTNGIRNRDIERIILTGGSSQWCFVREAVAETLHAPAEQLLTSENPKAAISEGLVVLPSLQVKYERVSNTLKSSLNHFFSSRIEPEIEKHVTTVTDRILKDVTGQLFDGRIGPLLTEFRERGGTIGELKEKIRAETISFLPQIEDITRTKLENLTDGLPEILHDKVSAWFRENGISYYGAKVQASALAAGTGFRQTADAPGIHSLTEEITNVTGAFVIGVSATIAGTIAGGAETALILSGPIGWIIGAVATVVTGWIALTYGKDAINELVDNLPLPAGVTRMILSDGKIRSISKEGAMQVRKQLQLSIDEAIDEPFAKMKREIYHNIELEIDGLTLINHL